MSPSGRPEVDPQSRKVRGVVMEGLFLKAVPQSPELVESLRQCGFDAARIESEYTALVFNACLEASRSFLHRTLPAAEGYQRLGVAQVEGIKATFLGAILFPPLKLVGPERILRRLPTLFKVDSTPAAITARETAPQHWRIEFRGDSTMIPDYIGGICKALVEVSGVQVTASARRTGVGDFDIELSW